MFYTNNIELGNIDTIFEHSNEFTFLVKFHEILTDEWQDYRIIADKLALIFPYLHKDNIVLLIGYCSKIGKDESFCDSEVRFIGDSITYFYRRKRPE